MYQRKAAHGLAQADGALTDAKARLVANDDGEKAGMIAADQPRCPPASRTARPQPR